MYFQEKQRNSYFDEFRIIKRLGYGRHAEIELGEDSTGNLVAIKKYKKYFVSPEIIAKEFQMMKCLEHEHLVRLVQVRQKGKYIDEDQNQQQRQAMILEYIEGGELFNYLSLSDHFSEKASRTFLKQILKVLSYIHEKGYAHFDVKPENILLSKNFSIKLTDFGHSFKLGSDLDELDLNPKSQKNNTPYLAPQIQTGKYDGVKCDIFACGVTLFFMYVGHPPFQKTSDERYRLLKEQKYDKFWKIFKRNKPENYFTEEFKHLFVRMVAYDPEKRPNIQEITSHSWVNGAIPTQEQLDQDFKKRKKKVQLVLTKRRMKLEQRMRMPERRKCGMRGGGLSSADIFEAQMNIIKNLTQIFPKSLDDLIILEEDKFFAIAKVNNKIKEGGILIEYSLEDQANFEDSLYLEVEKVLNEKNNMKVIFSYRFEIEGEYFFEKIEINFKFGKQKNERAVICFQLQTGNRLYFKKIVQEIKSLYDYC